MYYNPAQYVIFIFGGVRAAARALGRHPGAICNWKKARDRGGCGGDVPGPAQKIILTAAKEKGLDITPNDLIFGRRTKTA
jgi:hypothetical protein